MSTQIVDRALANEFGKDYKKVLVSLLKNNKPYAKVASGSLVGSINYRLVETANNIQVQLLANNYLKYVDEGRKPGTYPPIKAIQQWAQIKGIPQEAAWAIRANIFKFGIKPTRVLAKTRFTLETNRTYAQKYEKMVVDQLTKNIEMEWLHLERSLRLNTSISRV
jgi:hypothetical protein